MRKAFVAGCTISSLIIWSVLAPSIAVGAAPLETVSSQERSGAASDSPPVALRLHLTAAEAASAVVDKPAHVHLDSALDRLVGDWGRVAPDVATPAAQRQGVRLRNDRVWVTFLMLDEDAAIQAKAAVQRAGGEVTAFFMRAFDAWVPVSRLAELSELPRVSLVHRPIEAVPPPQPAGSPAARTMAGSYMTQGVAASNASAWHTAGVTGVGIKIGIIDQFQGWQQARALGELPAQTATLGSIDESSPHGTACAEIIYDMAPEASLTLTEASTATEMAAKILALASSGHRVVSASKSFLWTSAGDGTSDPYGVGAAVVQSRNQYGTVFVKSAGNYATAHWDGVCHGWTDSGRCRFDDQGTDLLFVGEASIPVGEEIGLALRWNSWPVTSQDYDLELWYNLLGYWTIVDSSVTRQTGSQPPTEWIRHTTSINTTYAFAIKKFDARGDAVMDVLSSPPFSLPGAVAGRSLSDQATYPSALSVAAVDVGSFALEEYSSRGPTHGPGGALSGGFDQPRIAGFANVDTWSYGSGGFNGTSAATPHVAGAVALVLSAYPQFTADQAVAFLEENAIDEGASGYDHEFGTGRLWLGSPPSACAFAVNPLQVSIAVEGGSTTVTVTTTANCSWTSTSNAAWLTITSGTSETGSGSTTVAVARNTSQNVRVGTVTVAGQTVQIGQAGPAPTCAYGVSPPSAVVPALGGNLDITISTDDGCAWSVISNASWITITAGSSGTGDGTASITVDSNSGAQRSGTLTIVDRTVQLTQEAGGSCNLPGAFVLSSPANGSSLPAPGATLAWAGSSGASEYDVYFGSSTSPALLRTVSTTSTQVSIATGTTYHWRVGAKNACGSTDSPATGTWSFAVSGGCNLPGEFDLTSPAEGAVERAALLTLTWAPASGATGYDVYFSTKNPPTTRLNSTTATATMVFGDLGTTYFWKVVATNACGTRESRIGSFRVRRADETLVYLLPSAAHVPGTNDTSWRTDVSMVNPGTETAVFSMLYQSMSDALQGTLSGSLAGHETVVWRDVLVKGFNLPPTVATKGTIRVESDMPLVLIARTYNETPSGTFGQEFPALCPIHALPAGKIGIIPHLSNNAAFRVNVGAVNLSAVNPCSVRFRVMDPLGRQVGQNVNLEVPAGRYLQRDRLFDAAGAGSLDLAYATVEVMTSGCTIWPFASIVDNATGDPTTIPAQWVP